MTSGKQSFETDESLWPVSQPIEKVEAKWQTAGEAEYIGDIPERKDELHAAFVLSDQANATVVKVDSTRALAMPGVVAFIDAQNVPGANNWKFTETVSNFNFLIQKIQKHQSRPRRSSALARVSTQDNLWVWFLQNQGLSPKHFSFLPSDPL